MLLKAGWGCGVFPLGWEVVAFAFEEVDWLVGAPTAGEARELTVAPGVLPPAGPPEGVEAGIARSRLI